MNIIKFDEKKLEKSVIGIIKDIGYQHTKGTFIERDSDKEVLITPCEFPEAAGFSWKFSPVSATLDERVIDSGEVMVIV